MMSFPSAPVIPLGRSTRRVFLAAILAASALLITAAPGWADEARVTFSNSLALLPVTTGTKTATPRVVASRIAAASTAELATPLEFNVAMKMRNFEEFQTRVSNGEQVPFAEMESKYLPLQSDYDTLRAWLVDQGFTVTMDDARRLGVFANGTAAQIQTSFGVTMQSVTVDGTTYTAASTAPSLPASIARGVLGINGLQPYLKAQKQFQKHPIGGTGGFTTQTNNTYPYLVPEIRKAYDGANLAVSGTTLTGVNQKIAIIIDALPLTSDLTSFWTQNSISQTLSNYETVNVPGGTADAAEGEESLDVEWASSTAPGCKVRVYCSDDLSFTNINKCLSQIATDVSGASPAQPQLHELSMSLGIGETYLGAGNSVFTTEAQYFTTIANGSATYGGVSVFVSAGDAGSTPDGTGHANGGPLQAEYESTDPNVTGVGGTALTLNSGTGLRTSEVVWNDPTAGNYYGVGATGGGTSIQFARPTWQVGTGVPAAVSGSKRLAPDVALVGAGSTPGLLVFNGTNYLVSGTSWSAPTWAGFAALINQGRSVKGRLPAGLLNPRIYPLIGTNNFTDITSGNNAGGANAGGNWTANVGYDECTGVGVPDVANLLNTLLGPTITNFTPGTGGAGTSVTITGANFYPSPSLPLSVKFNGTAATSVTVNSPTQITAVVPGGATSGPITVTSLGDATASGAAFFVGAPDLTVTKTHAGNFTYHDTGDTYTITVTNSGVAATSGTVSVVDTLPNGALTATNLTGTGWTIAANFLSATRTDALAAGGSYPPLTLTVSVPGSPQTTTNQVNVSGGGEVNTSNSYAQDSTTIIGQTPSQAWRYKYFGTNSNTGNAADTANPSGDGINNLTKYALGLDPTKPTANPEVEDTSTGYLRLTVPKNTDATDITYTVQVTGDLTNPASWTAVNTMTIQGTPTTVQGQDTVQVNSATKRFIRLYVSR